MGDDDNDLATDANNEIIKGKAMSEVENLKNQARLARLEAQTLEATYNLQKITKLEKKLHQIISAGESRDQIKLEIEQIAKRVDPSFMPMFANITAMMASESTSTPSTTSATSTNSMKTEKNNPSVSVPDLTPTELFEAYLAFLRLPTQMQIALQKAATLNGAGAGAGAGAGDVSKSSSDSSTVLSKDAIEEIIQQLNRQQHYLLSNPNKLEQIYKDSMQKSIMTASTNYPKRSNAEITRTDNGDTSDVRNISNRDGEQQQNIGDEITDYMEELYPRTTRKEGKSPTEKDANIFRSSILDTSNLFQTMGKPEPINGGYLIRGTSKISKKDTETKLVEALDQAFFKSELSNEFNFFYVRDPTPVKEDVIDDMVQIVRDPNLERVDDAMDEIDDLIRKPVILLLGKDMSPGFQPIILSAITTFSLFFAFLYAIGTFDGNDLVFNRLQEANAFQGEYNIDFFTQVLNQVIFPILAIQGAHEFAHIIVSSTYNFKMGPPVLIPSVDLIPFFGTKTDIKTSPPNYTALFDFALAGPLTGIIFSTIFFLLGLQMTADATSMEYFPSLPIELIKFSGLPTSILDASLGGELSTPLLNADLSSVKVHPFTIAGYTGLIVNALNLVPLGSTDGGRMSQAILGRKPHSVIQAFIYVAIFGAKVLGYDPTNIWFGFGLTCLFVQGDFEIPCRDEVEPVPIPRVFIATLLWIFAGLTLFPIL